MTPGIEEAWITAIGVAAAGVVGAGAAIIAGYLSRKSADDQITANSADVGRQIDASTAATKASIEASAAATKATIDASSAVLQAQLLAARGDKILDHKRTAYHELSAYLLYIQAKRRLDARTYRLDDEGEAAMQRLLGEYKPANWWELQARIAHYGSDEVIAQFEKSKDADDEIHTAAVKLAGFNQQANEARESGNMAAMPHITQIQAARRELQGARKEAEAIDQELVRRMRYELSWQPTHPEPIESPQPGPADGS